MPVVHNYDLIEVYNPAEGRRKLGITTIVGPQGPPGPQGKTGPTGPQGPAGGDTDLSFTPPLYESADVVSISLATATVDGYLSAADWVTFNAKVSSARLINTTAPLTGGGDLSADRTLAIPAATNAVDGYLTAADHTTFAAKEDVLTFSAPLSRLVNTISIPVATTLANGYLSSTDWTTFNAKVSTTRAINTNAPLTGGGDLSADRTLSIPAATSLVNGYLSSADWTTFNAKVSASRSISTTAPITGGGDLSADRTFAIAKATAVVDGYLAAADFVTFNAKVSTSRTLSTTSPITGGGDLSADRTFALDFTVLWTWTATNIAATPTDRITLTNTQAAISGTQQYSPALRFTGQGFGTTAGTSQACDFRFYLVPVQSTVPTATLNLDFSVAGGAFANKYTFSSAGTLSLANVSTTGSVTANSSNATALSAPNGGITCANDINCSSNNGNFVCGDSSALKFGNHSWLTSPVDGRFLMRNTAGTDFTRLQFGGTTSSFPALARSTTTLKCRLADDSADAGFTSAKFISSTTGVGFNGNAAVGKSSAYTPTNVTTDRSYNADATTLDEIADVLGTLIADLQTVGLLG